MSTHPQHQEDADGIVTEPRTLADKLAHTVANSQRSGEAAAHTPATHTPFKSC